MLVVVVRIQKCYTALQTRRAVTSAALVRCSHACAADSGWPPTVEASLSRHSFPAVPRALPYAALTPRSRSGRRSSSASAPSREESGLLLLLFLLLLLLLAMRTGSW